MNPIRVFAKQAARVPPFIAAGSATASPEVDAALAAALCHGLAKRPYHAARFLWCHDTASMAYVRIALHMEAIELSQTRWKKDSRWQAWASRIRQRHNRAASLVLADTVIAAAARPSEFDSVAKIMAYLKLDEFDEQCWRKFLRKPYNEVGAVLDGWAQAAFHHVNREQEE